MEKDFTPSDYQRNIYDFIEHGCGNLIIEASAGCGKTTTIVNALSIIPEDKSVLFCAFNRDIVKELKKKVGKRPNVKINTIHSLGLSIFLANTDKKPCEPQEFRYQNELRENLAKYTRMDVSRMTRKTISRYMKNVAQLIPLVQLNLSQTDEEALDLCEKHGINIIGDETACVFRLLEWGKENFDTWTYTDMVWLPLARYMSTSMAKYDFIFVDECQDLSNSSRELLLKCRKINTRYVFVGDESQAIYGFAGADCESFDKLRKLPNTTSLPLSISYRCAKEIVDYAKKIVPSIEHNPLNETRGEIVHNVDIGELSDGDMVLCRTNAPLAKIYAELLRKGQKCYIRGKDIGRELSTVVRDTESNLLDTELRHGGMFTELYDNYFKTIGEIMEKYSIDEDEAMKTSLATRILDKINTLRLLSDGLADKKELLDRIDKIFNDDESSEGVMLSTIHKAKGLESERVFIACHSLISRNKAKKEWEMKQERNLSYVAITRPKRYLGFLSEEGFEDIIDTQRIAIKRIKDTLKNRRYSLGGVGYEKFKYNEKVSLKSALNGIRRSDARTIGEKGSTEEKKSMSNMFKKKFTKRERI